MPMEHHQKLLQQAESLLASPVALISDPKGALRVGIPDDSDAGALSIDQMANESDAENYSQEERLILEHMFGKADMQGLVIAGYYFADRVKAIHDISPALLPATLQAGRPGNLFLHQAVHVLVTDESRAMIFQSPEGLGKNLGGAFDEPDEISMSSGG